MRLIEVTNGRILLDDVDLSSVDESIVRDRLICLTQDPLIFPGSLRENLSPAGHATEDAMATALERGGLVGGTEAESWGTNLVCSGLVGYTTGSRQAVAWCSVSPGPR